MDTEPRYKVGQRVIAIRNLPVPDSKRIILRGTSGEIAEIGSDGYYLIRLGDREILATISPVWNAPFKPLNTIFKED